MRVLPNAGVMGKKFGKVISTNSLEKLANLSHLTVLTLLTDSRELSAELGPSLRSGKSGPSVRKVRTVRSVRRQPARLARTCHALRGTGAQTRTQPIGWLTPGSAASTTDTHRKRSVPVGEHIFSDLYLRQMATSQRVAVNTAQQAGARW